MPCGTMYRPFLPYSIVNEPSPKELPSLHLDDASNLFAGTTKSKFYIVTGYAAQSVNFAFCRETQVFVRAGWTLWSCPASKNAV